MLFLGSKGVLSHELAHRNWSRIKDMSQPLLSIKNLSKSFGDHVVLQDINLDISKGEVVCVIGPSGSGKSTLLRCINFIAPPDTGEVVFEGKVWKKFHSPFNIFANRKYEAQLPSLRSEIGMVFQHFNVFPHMTAIENVMLGLTKVRQMDRTKAREVAEGALKQVGLGQVRSISREALGWTETTSCDCSCSCTQSESDAL
jgi:polar amino acid transport system ATP-binding protein